MAIIAWMRWGHTLLEAAQRHDDRFQGVYEQPLLPAERFPILTGAPHAPPWNPLNRDESCDLV